MPGSQLKLLEDTAPSHEILWHVAPGEIVKLHKCDTAQT